MPHHDGAAGPVFAPGGLPQGNQSSPLRRRPRRGVESLAGVGADGQQADVIDDQVGMEDPGDRPGDGRTEPVSETFVIAGQRYIRWKFLQCYRDP